MDEAFKELIDEARSMAKVPFVVNSGFRCDAHNQAVKSTSTNHTTGRAADIACRAGFTRLYMIRGLLNAGFQRLGIGQTYIHADTNNLPPAIWVY